MSQESGGQAVASPAIVSRSSDVIETSNHDNDADAESQADVSSSMLGKRTWQKNALEQAAYIEALPFEYLQFATTKQSSRMHFLRISTLEVIMVLLSQ